MLRSRFITGDGLSLFNSLVFEGRELVQTGKAKLLQKFECRSEDDRATHLLQSALFLDEPSIDECPEDAVRVDAADGFDLSAGDRLAVGDNGQGLDGGWREFGGQFQAKKLAHILGGFGGGDHLHTMPLSLEPKAACNIVTVQAFEGLLNLVGRCVKG